MPASISIENIEAMRQREGIDDVELREEIRTLGAGDLVRLTFRDGGSATETLAVRITSVGREGFQGRLVSDPSLRGLAALRASTAVSFSAAHIHSLAKRSPAAPQ